MYSVYSWFRNNIFIFFSGEKAEKTAEKMLDWVGFVETWRLWRSGSVAITFCLSKA